MNLIPPKSVWPSWVLAAAVVLALPSLFSTGCYHCHDDDDYDDDDHHCFDDDDDDDDRGNYSLRLERDSGDTYRLVKFVTVPSTEAGRHPVAIYDAIEGLQLPPQVPETQPGSTAGVMVPGTARRGDGGEVDPASVDPARVSTAAFERFTTLVLDHNPDLFGLPVAAGRLFFDRVDFVDSGHRVTWHQGLPDTDEGHFPVPRTAVVFHFDLVGSVTRIENRTFVTLPQ